MKKRFLAHSERGQSFLELAISLTLLLILLAGAVDLGRAFFTFISIRDSVQEGASYAAIAPYDCQGIIKRIEEHTDTPINLQTDLNVDIDVKITRSNGSETTCTSTSTPVYDSYCPGGQIDITVTYNNFQITTPFLGTFIGTQSLPLSAQVIDSILIDPDPVSSPCP